MNHNDFDSHFSSMSKNIERTRKAMLPVMIVSGVAPLAVVAFVCWAIYRLVTHFTG